MIKKKHIAVSYLVTIVIIAILALLGCKSAPAATNTTPPITTPAQQIPTAPPTPTPNTAPGPLPIKPPGYTGPVDNVSAHEALFYVPPFIKGINGAPEMVTNATINQTIINPNVTEVLRVVVSPTGSGYVSPASATVPQGTWVTLIPTPASGYKFFEWEIDGLFYWSINPTLVLLMDSSKTITAHFRLIEPPP